MRMARPVMMAVCGLLVALWASGCQSPEQIQIEELQSKNLALQRENDDLRARLAKAINERNEALARARALQQQVDELSQEPAEAAPKDWERSGQYAWISVSTDFLFPPGVADLNPQARPKLHEIVSQIQATYPDRAIWVVGHTDNEPITKSHWKDNLDLSLNRGAAVYRELMKLGLRPERMIAAGQGEWFPKAGNNSTAGMTQNRRVEIIAVPARPAVGTPSGTPLPPKPAHEAPGLVPKAPGE